MAPLVGWGAVVYCQPRKPKSLTSFAALGSSSGSLPNAHPPGSCGPVLVLCRGAGLVEELVVGDVLSGDDRLRLA